VAFFGHLCVHLQGGENKNTVIMCRNKSTVKKHNFCLKITVGPVNLKCALNIGYATMERNPLQFYCIQQADQSSPITNRRRESGEQ